MDRSMRLTTLDILRGVAVLGILAMNIPGFALPRMYPDNLVRLEGIHTLNYYIGTFDYIFLNGKMRGMLSMVFGAGIILFTQKDTSIRLADAYFRRMLWLLVFALITTYFFLASTGILYEYALCGMLLFAFRNMRARRLILLGVLCLAIFAFKNGLGFMESQEKWQIAREAKQQLAQGKQINKEQEAAIHFWKNGRNPPVRMLDSLYAADIKLVQSGYASIFEENAKEFTEIFSIVFYSTFWETFGTILIGMGLFKTGFFSGNFTKRRYALIALISLAVGIPFAAYLESVLTKGQLDVTGEFFDTRWFSVFHMDQVPRISCVIGYSALLILLYKMGWLKRVFSTLASVGRMAFSNYLLQNIFCSVFFFGFGMFGTISYFDLHILVALILLVQISLTLLWLRVFSIGPFEWLWRRLTYGKQLHEKISPPNLQGIN